MSEVIASVATGYWDEAGTWTGGVVPGSAGHEEAHGEIEVGHTVTIRTDPVCGGFTLNGGALILNANFTFVDANGTGFWIDEDLTSSFTSNATASAPRYFIGPNTAHIPTILFSAVLSGPDTRTLDFDYVILQFCSGFIGNEAHYIRFETGTSTTAFVTNIVPMVRDLKLISHYIEGRGYGRTYIDGGSCGVIQVSGVIHWDSYDQNNFRDMMADATRVAFLYKDVIMPKCFIERLSFNPKAGSLWIPFTMTLIEEGND